MAYFPDFAATARLGFEQGRSMGEGQNPLGQFIKTMLADWQQRRTVEQEVGIRVAGERGIAKYKQQLEEESETGKTKLGISKIQLGVIQEAKKRYDVGDRSPEVLKALDIYATPNIFNIGGLDTILPDTSNIPQEKIRVKRMINGKEVEGTISPQFFNPKTDKKI